ncbi:MAG: hypothetical protein IJR61_06435 [Clostridia bacterium]|nr:hypothetical protein [Clostridia bacterium]
MKFNDIFKDLNLTDYAPIPFWSWNNELDENELVRQIHDMKEAGMGGFIMHARTGLTTPYLGEKWFRCIEVCLDEAKKLGMNGWIYDENGWPSGFAGGELLKEKENLATYLEIETGAFDPQAYCSFICDKGGFRRVNAECGAGEYYNVMLRYSPANTDILKPSLVKKFIDATYEEYYRRFKDRFGKELKGFFTDEPQYFRWGTPYTVELIGYFKERYGEDVRDGLIHLFFDGEEDYPFRVRYYSAMNDLYTQNYYKRIYDWCVSHGCGFTGHSVEETKLFTQMWGCAGCSPSYEYETIPGIDNLGKTNDAVLSARQVGSVAAQLGKKQVLTETFGCSGYDVTPRELRHIAEKQYVHGVNLMCHHLYSYSLAGQGKTDHPPCFSKHMTWWNDFPSFNEYFTRLGYLLAEGKTDVKAVVISPMTSVYLKYKRFDEEAAKMIDEKFAELQKTLSDANIEYHIADEKLLKKYGKVNGKALTVGNCEYDFVIVPYSPNVFGGTAEIIDEYLSQGGKLYLFDGVPSFVDGKRASLLWKTNVTIGEIKAGGSVVLDGDGVEFTHRKTDKCEFIYAVNVKDAPVTFRYPAGYVSADILSGETTDLGGSLTLRPQASALLVKGFAETQKAPQITHKIDITDNFSFVSCSENNLTIDYIRVSTDGKNYSAPRYVYDVFYALVRESYKGKLWVKYEFETDGKYPLTLLKEWDKGGDYRVNGKPVTFRKSGFDVKFLECDITGLVKAGANEFTYVVDFYQRPEVRYALFDPEATESLRNCLYFDTEIEPVYIKGYFSVNGRRIEKPVDNVPVGGITEHGFAYFAGEMKFEGKFTAPEGKAVIELCGNYSSASLEVNGKTYSATLGNRVIVDTIEGENRLNLTFSASLRNMFGPFHCTLPEAGISPYNFRMPDCYDGNEKGIFTEKYVIKPFGMEKITVEY